ncbi:MAG: phenylalanine--tRNA ligase subunit alpha, partial [Clostridia bacterium]|nr:phenylalanine--tRNA ligase subunit alpha [Clostridia bacterium]
MKEKLQQIKQAALAELQAPDCDTEAVRVKYLGKKGELTAVLRGMGALSPEERPVVGQMANDVRAEIEAALAAVVAAAKEKALNDRLAREKLDVTMPGKCERVGHQHPLTRAQREMEEIFIGMGFEIAEGPEVEYDYYNFQALNIPENHPARDTQDTFYITDKILLRSQTSPVQVRVMEKQSPP